MNSNRALVQTRKLFWRTSRMITATDEQLHKSTLLPIFRLVYNQHGISLNTQQLKTLVKLAENLDSGEIGCAENPSPLWKGKKDVCLWTEIFECEDFCLNIFRMPAGFSLPVHDHPEMTGVNTILHGRIKHSSYTWQERITKENKLGLVAFEKSGESTPTNNKCIATQTEAGNVHTLTALEDTTIFQVLCPNYDFDQRSCSFFALNQMKENLFQIKKINSADDYLCGGVPYSGISGKQIFDLVASESLVQTSTHHKSDR